MFLKPRRLERLLDLVDGTSEVRYVLLCRMLFWCQIHFHKNLHGEEVHLPFVSNPLNYYENQIKVRFSCTLSVDIRSSFLAFQPRESLSSEILYAFSLGIHIHKEWKFQGNHFTQCYQLWFFLSNLLKWALISEKNCKKFKSEAIHKSWHRDESRPLILYKLKLLYYCLLSIMYSLTARDDIMIERSR
jgi:hypothetical protein